MLSWVVKVVPQPPEPPTKKVDEQKEEKPAAAPPPAPAAAPPPVQEKKVKFQDECTVEAPKADKPKQEAQAAEENGPAAGSQPGMLMWISGALPQPAVSPKLSRSNSTTKEESPAPSKPEDDKGMIAWIAQGLEKVVPKPELKSKEPSGADQPAEVQPTPATAAAAAPPAPPAPPAAPAAPAAPEPQVSAVKVEPEREDKTDNKPLQPSVIDWIKQGIEKVVPQPEIHSKTDAPASSKAAAPTPEPPPAPKPAADTESSKETEPQPNVVGWIFNEIGRMLPQPVQKQDAAGEEVQSRGKGGKSPLK